jgi:hypothetical protein
MATQGAFGFAASPRDQDQRTPRGTGPHDTEGHPPAPPPSGRTAQGELAHAAAVLGPMLEHPGGLVATAEELVAGLAVCDALAEYDPGGGLTVAELHALLGGRFDRASVERRIKVLLANKTLRRRRPRPYEPRIVLTVRGALARLLLPLLLDGDGHRQLIELLDRTRARALRPEATEAEIGAALRSIHRLLRTFTNQFTVLLDSRTVTEMVREVAEERTDELQQQLEALREVIDARFGGLLGLMDEVGAELRAYLDALGQFVRRIFADRAGFHDPRVLRPAEYDDAAKVGSVAQLAAVFDGIVFDAAPVLVAADVAAEAFLAGRDRPDPVAPPEPAGAEVGVDPIRAEQQAQQRTMQRRAALAERFLQRGPTVMDGKVASVDLTEELRTRHWPGPVLLLGDLFELAGDAEQPYGLSIADGLLVSVEGPYSYLSPVALHADRSAAQRRLHQALQAEADRDGPHGSAADPDQEVPA